MNDVLGLRDQRIDPVVSATSYGMPKDDFVRVSESYEVVPYSGGDLLIKRVVTPRAPGEPVRITVRCNGAAASR